jgi:RNA polymerase sigma-70 factor (sigma-E family)
MSFTTKDTGTPTFEEYAAAAWPALYRYAYLLAGNHPDAEDVAQQTLIKAHRAWSRVTSSDSPHAYVRRMLTNTYLSAKRPRRRGLELLTDEPPEPVVAAPAVHEERAALWPHVKALPPQQRAVIVLRYFEDLSEAEIADVLGCSRGNVKSTAHRALKALRAAIGSEDNDGRED